MFDPETFPQVLLGSLTVAALGAVLLVLVGWVRRSGQRADVGGLKGALRIAGWLLLVPALAAMLFTAVVVIAETLEAALDFAEFMGFVLLAAVAGLVALIGTLLLSVARSLGRPLSPDERHQLDRKLTTLQVIGWLGVICPVVVFFAEFSFGLIFLPLLLIGLGVIVFLIVANRRKADQATVLWHLAIAVERGRPLADEVELLAETTRGRVARMLMRLSTLLRSGIPFPEALPQVSGLVPASTALAVDTGSRTGMLAEALREEAGRLTGRLQMRTRVANPGILLILYVWLVPTIFAHVVAFNMYYILPKYKKIFLDFDIELPAFTEAFIDVADVVVDFGGLLIPVWMGLPTIVIVLAGIGYYRGWGEFDVPVVPRWFTRFDSPGILRNLARYVAASRPLTDGLAGLAVRHRRRHIRERCERALQLIERGEDDWTALQRQGLIRPREAAALQAAQRARHLVWAMNELAATVERTLTHRWLKRVQFVEPVLVIGLGLIVFSFSMAFFSPLLKLINDLS